MDELDQALLDAWHALSAELKDKPWKLGRRMERAARQSLRRPVRAWCVALRASDRRISGGDLPDEPAVERCRRGYTHNLLLTGERLRELCAARRPAF